MPLPKRGEVWQVDFGLAAKVRPALVVSVAILENERALYAVMPHTTALWGTRFEVPLAIRWLEKGAFDGQGIRPVPSKVFLRRLGALTTEQMATIEASIAHWFGLASR